MVKNFENTPVKVDNVHIEERLPYMGYSIGTALGAGNVVLTSAQALAGGLLTHQANGNTLTTPTAALLVSYCQDNLGYTPTIGDTFELNVYNVAAGGGASTVTAGVGVTVLGTAAIATGVMGRILFRFTNVTAAAEAVTAYVFVSA